jgi:hypothetical protein
MNNHSDGEVLHDAVDGRISEFMDEYIIIGKKAGRRQKMIISTIKQEDGFLSKIYEECLEWAYRKGKYNEGNKYE